MNAQITQPKSLVFNYVQEDYEKWVQNFANHLNVQVENDRLQCPPTFADGFTTAKNVEPGLSYRLAHYSLNADVDYHRSPADKFQLLLYFYEMEIVDAMYCKIDGQEFKSTEKAYSIALLTTSQAQQHLHYKKGTKIKGLAIQMDEEWLDANLENFASYRIDIGPTKSYLMDFINAKQRKIITDIFNAAENSQFTKLYVKSRVLRLAEQFLTNLCRRGLSDIPDFTNQKDFQALLSVENLLLKNYMGLFPSIETLAKTALMSESKLKKLFKKAFGLAPYEYYQKNRMHKAKEMLRTRKHSVTQVGGLLGYQNMSNFSAAFKKEFNYLPSQVHEVA
jgi:AraC-like DNA-binding protein